MKTDFLPVYPHFYEIFDEAINKERSRIIYFGSGTDLMEENDKILFIEKNELNEEFLIFRSEAKVRIDRIISVNGKPGPAFDEYDRYGLACLDCNFETN